jgi:uncharacterized protein YjbI with pentapeptide repeats
LDGDFHNAYLGNADFTGARFKDGFNFNSYATDTNFNGIYVKNGYFLSGKFKNVTFRNASLVNADFALSAAAVKSPTVIDSVDFTGANLKNANFTRTWLSNTNFTNANLNGAVFYHFDSGKLASNNFTGADLRNVKLLHTSLDHVLFRKADFSDSKLEDISFVGANLESANLARIDSTGMTPLKIFRSLDCVDAPFGPYCELEPIWWDVSSAGEDILSFKDANLNFANLESAKLFQAVFDGADLTNANLNNVDCSLCSFKYANLSNVSFIGAKFPRVSVMENVNIYRHEVTYAVQYFNSATLVNADFSNADLSGAVFNGANLRGAKFNSHIFNGANLSGATWIDGRICAEGSIGECK